MPYKPTYRLSLSILFAVLVSSTVAYSHAQSQIPQQTNPGLLLPAPTEQTQERRKQQEEREFPSPMQAPQVQLEVPEQQPTVQIPAPSFPVNKISIEGATVINSSDLKPIIEPYLGKEVALSDLQQIVNQINQLYRSKGYLTTQTYIPPQQIENGNIVVKVVEGRVGKVCLTGNKYYKSDVVLRGLDVKQGDIFNIRALEKSLNASNQHNRYQLKAVLSAGVETGSTDIRIETVEAQPWQVSPTFDNQGRPFIGTYRGGVDVTNDSLQGYGDRLTTQYRGAAGTQLALGSYFFPVNGKGDEVGLSYGYSHTDVDLGVANQPDIDGTAHDVGLLFSHPFDESRTWVGDIGLNARRIRTFFNGDTTSKDDIRSLQVGLNYNKFDHLGRTYARVQTSAGLDVLGGNAQFWKTEGFLTRLFNLPMDNVLMLRLVGQYSPDALPSAEEFQLGGAYSVRGYTEGLLLGDRGYSLSVEDRWPVPFLRHVSPWLADRVQGAVFYDIGQSWLDRSNPLFIGGESNDNEHSLLMSAGFGFRARLSQYLEGFLDVGFGLMDRNEVTFPNGDPTARIHFGIRSNLLPQTLKSRSSEVTCIQPAGTGIRHKAGHFR